MLLAYPVVLTPDGDSILVTFPDIPEAITQGSDIEDALRQAGDALETAMEFYFEQRKAVPLPGKSRHTHTVELPLSLSAKVLLLNEMIRQDVKPAELARRMKTSPQVVNRLTNIRHTTKIDQIAFALKNLGKKLELQIHPG